MRFPAIAAVGLAALGIGACGPAGTDTSKFTGEQRDVAKVVADLRTAGERRKPDDICNNLLTTELQNQIKAAGASCAAEMKKAIEDADGFDLQVKSVRVSGTSAVADIHSSDAGKGVTRSFSFTKQGGKWRIANLGTPVAG